MKFSILVHCGSREWLRTISYSSFNLLSIWTFSLLQNIFKGKWNKQITIAFVEFGLEFNLEKIILNKLVSFSKINMYVCIFLLKTYPVQTESMEKSRQSFHQTQNADCQDCPKTENDPQNDSTIPEKNQKNFRTKKFGI